MNYNFTHEKLDQLVASGMLKSYEFVCIDKNPYGHPDMPMNGSLTLTFPNGMSIKIVPNVEVPSGCDDWAFENVALEES